MPGANPDHLYNLSAPREQNNLSFCHKSRDLVNRAAACDPGSGLCDDNKTCCQDGDTCCIDNTIPVLPVTG